MNGFDDCLTLLRLISDPDACKARLTELRAEIAAAAARQDEAAAAHDRLDVEREKLARLEASLREREVAVFESERRHKRELDALAKWKREHAGSRLIQHMNGLTSEPDDTPEAPDPIDRFADSMDLAPGTFSSYGPAPVRSSRRRA